MIHSFNVEIAEEYGIPSAIILQQIADIIQENERNSVPKVDGKTWMSQGSCELAKLLPYFTDRTIRRALASMVEAGLLVKNDPDSKSMDRSPRFALTDKAETLTGQNVRSAGQNVRCIGQIVRTPESQTGQGFEHTSTSREEADSEEPRIYIDNKHIVSDKEKNTDKNSIVRKEIIEYLNHRAGTHYRDGAIAQKHINARLSEGYTVEDFKTVIDSKCAEWLRTDMAKYLRPETLFGTKMDGYLGQAGMKARTVGPNGIAMDPDLLEDEELRIIFGG